MRVAWVDLWMWMLGGAAEAEASSGATSCAAALHCRLANKSVRTLPLLAVQQLQAKAAEEGSGVVVVSAQVRRAQLLSYGSPCWAADPCCASAMHADGRAAWGLSLRLACRMLSDC